MPPRNKKGPYFDVSVVGDATFNIPGPICVGSGNTPAGTNCPVQGDRAVADCHKYLTSSYYGSCYAPTDATCKKLPTGAWGCVWTTPPGGAKGPQSNPGIKQDVSVAGDATFNIAGPVCSGSGTSPIGNNCPKQGDKAVKNCKNNSFSFDSDFCVAPTDAACTLFASGTWGCAWAFPEGVEPVSVAGDATFNVAGPVCSGSDTVPFGKHCPRQGDIAIAACKSSYASFTNGLCIAPIDATCAQLPTGTWGCKWPFTGALPPAPSATTPPVDTVPTQTPCPSGALGSDDYVDTTSAGVGSALSAGTIAGIVVAICVALGCTAIGFYYIKHKQQKREEQLFTESEDLEDASTHYAAM